MKVLAYTRDPINHSITGRVVANPYPHNHEINTLHLFDGLATIVPLDTTPNPYHYPYKINFIPEKNTLSHAWSVLSEKFPPPENVAIFKRFAEIYYPGTVVLTKNNLMGWVEPKNQDETLPPNHREPIQVSDIEHWFEIAEADQKKNYFTVSYQKVIDMSFNIIQYGVDITSAVVLLTESGSLHNYVMQVTPNNSGNVDFLT